MDVQGQESFSGKQKLQKAHVELAFQSATNTDGVSGLRGAMCRAELLNFLIRLARTWQTLGGKAGVRRRLSDNLNYFFTLYVDPIIDSGVITEHRRLIRASPKLNDLLYHNRGSLEKIFGFGPTLDPSQKGGLKRYNIAVAKLFFGTVLETGVLTLARGQIEECFNYSMMTVHSEPQNSRKYDYLVYIEWLEMVCRMCLVGFDHDADFAGRPIAEKVQKFLKAIWQWLYDKGYWDPFDRELHYITLENPPVIEPPDSESSVSVGSDGSDDD